MNKKDLIDLTSDLNSFYKRFESYFERPEPREQGLKYITGLIASTENRNSWNIAQVVGDKIPDRTQRLLYRAIVKREEIEKEYRRFCREEFSTKDGIFVVDETGFIKKGDKSAGVQRQYSGTAGKIENCQIGVFVSYTSGRNHALLGGKLYLPNEWAKDQIRREGAKIPKEIEFKTKPQLALEILENLADEEFPGKWVTADEVYGSSHEFRDGVENLGLNYVVAIRSNFNVYKIHCETNGRPTFSFWEKDKAKRIDWVAKNLPEYKWKKLTLSNGEKGPISYLWAMIRIRIVDDNNEYWLLMRRSINNKDEISFYLSNADQRVALKTLARIALSRYTVEQCFEEAKGEAGMDEYEVRYWESWHRHIIFSMMAHAFLAFRKKKREGHIFRLQ